LEQYGEDVDTHSISVVPLGGRHVNHFWRLLNTLKIPFVTLLDFDIDRNGGGFGRMKYAVEQLLEMDEVASAYIRHDVPALIPDWTDPRNPNLFNLVYGDETKNIVHELEECNVFFSSPLDIDYSMICAFPEIFCSIDASYGERGPSEGKEDEEDGDRAKREEALVKAVLKKGNVGRQFEFGDNWERNFLWYRYRFLSSKSKPASHVRMFSNLCNEYTAGQIRAKLPPELNRLAERVIQLAEEIIE
jgi:hypothetical protein